MAPDPPRSPPSGSPLKEHQLRQRSVGFLQVEGDRWACFLVTYRAGVRTWRGYFSFRPCAGEEPTEPPPEEPTEPPPEGSTELVRTADIFMEEAESEIDRKARSLGRPLLTGLLSSALHTRQRTREKEESGRTFRSTVADGVRKLALEGAARETPAVGEETSPQRLRSLYSSYRLDQVAHLITLVDPGHFPGAVDRILQEARVDFSTQDRLQFAMMVVERLEALLPLPPYEVWVEDFLAHMETYRLYSHGLHREGALE